MAIEIVDLPIKIVLFRSNASLLEGIYPSETEDSQEMNITGWWFFRHPSETYGFVSWEYDSQYMEIWNMFQNTNQIKYVAIHIWVECGPIQ